MINLGEPTAINAIFPIICPGNLSVNRSGGVGIIAKVYGHQAAFFKGVAVVESPEGCFQ